MKDNNILSWCLTGISGLFTWIQDNEIMQIISLCVTILSGVVSLAFNIYKWVKKAKKDGKITEEEIDELASLVEDGLNPLKDITNKKED